MAYTIEKCDPSDAEVIAKLHLATSLTAPRFKVTYGACNEDDLISMWLHEARDSLSNQDPHFPQERHSFKAVDSTTHEIAAYAIWMYLENGYNHLNDSELFRQDADYPSGVNIACLEEFSDKIVALRRKHAKGIKPLWRTYLISMILSVSGNMIAAIHSTSSRLEVYPTDQSITVLAVLGTHPDHRGQGLAGRLVRSIYPQADAAGITCYVDSSAAGLPVYKKCEFEEVDSISLDLEKYEGGKGLGEPKWTALLRMPKTA